MTGSTLAVVRGILKAELGVVGSADDALLNQRIVNKQNWFSARWWWSCLEDMWDVTVSTGTQLPSFATTDWQGNTATMRLDMDLKVAVFWNNTYQELVYGIGEDQYNTFNFALGQTQDPIQRWRRVGTTKTKFEVWPVPASPQVVRFTGQKTTTAFTSTPADADIVDLDDLLIAMSVAADWLMEKGKGGWQAKAALARELFIQLQGNEPQAMTRFKIGRDEESSIRQRVVPLKVIAVH